MLATLLLRAAIIAAPLLAKLVAAGPDGELVLHMDTALQLYSKRLIY